VALGGRAAGFIWDYEGWDSLTCPDPSGPSAGRWHLPLAFSTRGGSTSSQERRAAASLVEQADALAEATDSRIVPAYGALALAAFRGREDEMQQLARTSTPAFIARGEGMGLTVSQWVTAVLYNGLARYEDAFAAAAEATMDPHELWFSTFATVELIEAASRSGRGTRAAEALEVLSESTRASGTPGHWASKPGAPESREEAETLYREATVCSRRGFVWTRARICSTACQRRERRRRDA
jgi:hypothetical protein